MTERCVCAAIKMPDGQIVKGKRHNNCIADAVSFGYTRNDIARAVQGFVTNLSRFVDRTEGMEIQKGSGIPSAYSVDGQYRGEVLFSEDLY